MAILLLGSILSFTIAVFFMSGVAHLNGFPLVYFDSGTYLQVALENLFPDDRSVFYGMFIKEALRFKTSIQAMSIVYAQSIITAITLLILSRRSKIKSTLVIILTCLLSSLSFWTGQIMADIFTGLMLLSFAALASRRPLSFLGRIWMIAVLAYSISAHSSHLLIMGLMTSLIFFLQFIPFNFFKTLSIKPIIAPVLLSLIFIGTVNYQKTGALFINSQGGHHFLMASALRWKIVQPTLQKNCPQMQSPFCEYKDLFETDLAQNYLWDERSPITKFGWKSYKKEVFQLIALSIANSPETFLKAVANDVVDQFSKMNTGEGSYSYAPNKNIVKVIEKHFPNNNQAFQLSLQQTNVLQPLVLKYRFIHYYVGIISILICALLFFFKGQSEAFLLILGLIVNNIICGTVSLPDDRYASRALWPIVFYALRAVF